MDKQKWHYKGPVYFRYTIVQDEYEAYTTASSYRAAKRNILHKFLSERQISYKASRSYNLSDLSLNLVKIKETNK